MSNHGFKIRQQDLMYGYIKSRRVFLPYPIWDVTASPYNLKERHGYSKIVLEKQQTILYN